MNSTSKWFVNLTKVTLVAIMLVIIAGGVVRMTGSGMGCPDWPKCFEQYIPPTSVDQLPLDYKEKFSAKRSEKLDRFISLLRSIGIEETADKLNATRASILIEQDFNAANTWTEYANRLIGALSGFFVLICLVSSIKYRKVKWLVLLCFFQLIIIGFQGWMGAMTVVTNLTPWVLTLHMLVAIFIVGLQLKIIRLALGSSARKIKLESPLFPVVVYLAIVLSAIQIIFGTEVRQSIDFLELSTSKNEVISQLGGDFIFHRSFAWLVLLVNMVIYYLNYQSNMRLWLANAVLGLVVLEAMSGIGMAWFGIPPILQPIHLVLGTLLISAQIYLAMIVKWK